MSNIQSTAKQYIKAATALGIEIPNAITQVLDPANSPAVQLARHLDGIPTPAEAVTACIDAGKDPSTSKDVQRALTAQQVRAAAGNLPAALERRIANTFQTEWDNIIDAANDVFEPAAHTLTDAHQVLASRGLDLTRADDIRRAGGDALTAWAAGVTAADTLRQIPALLTAAWITGRPNAYGQLGRIYWAALPDLDTWNSSTQVDVQDPWAVLDAGAALTLARTAPEAQHRAQLASREQALANAARAAAARRGGFGEDARPIEYEGADGVTRTITGERVARSISTVKSAFGHEQEV